MVIFKMAKTDLIAFMATIDAALAGAFLRQCPPLQKLRNGL